MLTFLEAVTAACVFLAASGPSQAQTSPQPLPGLVVSAPPPSAPPAAAPAAKAPAPAKPKPAAKAAAAAPSESGAAKGAGGGGQAIAVLVNDDPITAYEIEQRARLMSLQSNIGERAKETMERMVKSEATQQAFRAQLEEVVRANQGIKSREQILALVEEKKKQFSQNLQRQAIESARASVLPGMKKAAIEELVEERLKLQEAKRLNITTEDAKVDGMLKGLAERNKMTEAQFTQHMSGMGVDTTTMKSRFRAMLAWADVVRRRFSAQINVNQRDIDRFISTAPETEDEIELQLQRITLAVPGKIDQRVMAQRFDEADRLRNQFAGCKTAAALATKLQNAKFEDLGIRKPSTIAEPTRSLLLNAKDGEMVPPSMATTGVELYAVCGRKVVKADEQKRTHAQQELQQKEFEVMAKRHLRDLRQDAHIEYR